MNDLHHIIATAHHARQEKYGLDFTPEAGVWYPIEKRPTTDVRFLVGGYFGEKLWNGDFTDFVWTGDVVWRQALSHNENPHGPNSNVRGWNHRNGPLGPVQVTHWSPCPEPPTLTNRWVPSEPETSDP